jgi:predicted PurR-regulated permease PerM
MSISDISLKKVTKFLLGLVSLVFLVYFSVIIFDIIIMLILSILLAFIFNPLVMFLEKNGLNRLVSVLLVFLIAAFLTIFGFSVLIPKIVKQLNVIAANFSKENIDAVLGQFNQTLTEVLPLVSAEEITQQISTFFSELLVNSINNITEIVTSIISILAIVVIVPFMTFFILKDKHKIVKGIIDVMPNKYFEVSYWVIKKISDQLGRYVRSWIFDAFIVGLMATIGLSILGIQNSITIGAIAGIGHLIPYFGPVIGGLPAIIISLIQFGDLSMLPSITLMFVIIYTFDNGYIQPNVFSKGTDIHPLLIIILILVGSQAMGILGMLLAVPAATVIKTAAREIYYGYKNYRIIRV